MRRLIIIAALACGACAAWAGMGARGWVALRPLPAGAAQEWFAPYATSARGIWSLDKGNANDYGPGGYHGAVSGGAAYVSGGMDFDGTNDFVQLPTNCTPSGCVAVTVAVKCKRDSNAVNMGQFGGYTASSYFFAQNGVEAGKSALGGFGGAAYAQIVPTNVAPVGSTNVIVWVFDGAGTGNGGRLKLYVNGTNYPEAFDSLTFVGTVGTNIPPANFGGLRIGSIQGLGRYWDGTISRVLVDDAAMSSNEAQTLTERMWLP